MSSNGGVPEVKRNLFFPGQQLLAEDLIDLNLANRELRWLHNRALHNWGIGIGLQVQAQRGDSVVTIEPGFALDCLGREILLIAEQTKTVPAVAGESGAEAIFYLVITYKDDADQQVLEKRPGVCHSGGSVRLAEDPMLTWRLPNELLEGQDIVLAKASILNCRLTRALSLAERRNARPAQQPYIYSGQTGSQDTPWQVWLDPNQPNKRLGVFVQVDSSLARFNTQPTYIAHIVGERFSVGKFSLVSFAAVANPTSKQFTLQVLLPNFGPNVKGVNPSSLTDQGLLAALKSLNWHVAWMGVEG